MNTSVTMYPTRGSGEKEKGKGEGGGGKREGEGEGKVNVVCDAVRKTLEQIDENK